MRRRAVLVAAVALAVAGAAHAEGAAKVVSTFPPADAVVPAGIDRIAVSYDRTMMDGSWSFATGGEQKFPEVAGQPVMQNDHKSFVLPVKLKPNTTYVIWFNTDRFKNFKDDQGQPAEPYRLTFSTSD